LNLVKEMDAWMKSAPQNVLVVHCKAGRSRTGVAVCAYLLYTGLCADAESAIKLFNSKRSLNENGVVLPSQMRAIASFERVVKEGQHLLSSPKRLYLKEIIIKPVVR
jgi:protein-tyrosine phosphatase